MRKDFAGVVLCVALCAWVGAGAAGSARAEATEKAKAPSKAGFCSVVFDRTPPVQAPPKAGVTYISKWPVNIRYAEVDDRVSGLSHVELYVRVNDGSWQAAKLKQHGRSGVFTYSGASKPGTFVFGIKSWDRAGNVSPMATSPEVVLDPHPPAVKLNPVSSPGAGQDLAVSGTAADKESGVARVEVRLNNGGWHKASGTGSWSIRLPAPGPGTHRVDARAVDRAGNVSPVVGASVKTAGNRPPKTPSTVTPFEGGSVWGETPTLRGTDYSDPDKDPQGGSRWQVAFDPAFKRMAYDSGTLHGSTDRLVVPPRKLKSQQRHWWRLRYLDSRGAWSEWSAPAYFDTPTAYYVEEALPAHREARPEHTVAGNSPLAVRFRPGTAVDLDSFWGEVTLNNKRLDGEWKFYLPEGGAHDIWLVFVPAKRMTPGALVRLEAGADTHRGAAIEPVEVTYVPDKESLKLSKTGAPELRFAKEPHVDGLPRGMAQPRSPVYRLGPATVFEQPVELQIPVASEADVPGTDLYYYSESMDLPGWYKGDNVAGWLVPGSRRVIRSGKKIYLRYLVNHAGVVQLGRP